MIVFHMMFLTKLLVGTKGVRYIEVCRLFRFETEFHVSFPIRKCGLKYFHENEILRNPAEFRLFVVGWMFLY